METQEQKRVRQNGYAKTYRRKNLAKCIAAQAAYRQNHPERCRDARTLKRFGIPYSEYESRLSSQNNLCAACLQPFDISVELLKPVLDHCHETGKLREFVHRGCNLAIEHVQESSRNARLLAEYLDRHAGGTS